MDEIQLQFHIKQKSVQENSIEGGDFKWKIQNKNDDVSCWSDTQRYQIAQPLNEECSFFEDQDILKTNNSQQIQHQQQNYGQIIKLSQNLSQSIDNTQVNNSSDIPKKQRDKKITRIRTCNDQYYKNTFPVVISKLTETNMDEYQSSRLEKQIQKQLDKERMSIIHSQRQSKILNIKMLLKMKFKIIHFFKKYTLSGRTYLMNQSIRQKINDVSDYQIDNNIQSYIPALNILNISKQIPLINNQSLLWFCLKIFFTIVNSLFLYIFSLLVIFQVNREQTNILLSIIIPIWVFEILTKLNIEPQNKIGTVFNRKQIIKNYFRTESFFDLVPLFMSLGLFNSTIYFEQVLVVFVFLKIPNFIYDLKNVEKRLCMMIKRYYLVQIFNLIFQLFAIGHIISCLWYMLSKAETKYFSEQKSWIDDLSTDDQIWWRLYIWSLYWSISLMTTGSNTATTISQAFFTTFIILFTTTTFAYFLNVIGIILQEFDQKHQQKRKDISIINEYMRKRNISKNLQAEVNRDLQFYYKKNYKKIQEDNNEVLEKISQELQQSILKEQNKKIFNKIDFLQSTFSSKSLEELSLQVKEEFYLPNQIIINENDSKICSIMYILSGSVELAGSFFQDYNLKTPIKKFKEGQIFGQINFFTGQTQTPCVRSKEFTKIIRIERDCFLNIIKENEQDYEKFCQIKDNILLYSSYSDINLFCKNCNQKSHLSYQCHLINIDKDVCFYNILKSQQDKQNRQVFKRKQQRKSNSYKHFVTQKNIIKIIKGQLKVTQNQEKTFQRIEALYSIENSNCSDYEDISGYDSDMQSEDVYLKKTLENLSTLRSDIKNDENSTQSKENSAGVEEQQVRIPKRLKSFKVNGSSLSEIEGINQYNSSMQNSVGTEEQQIRIPKRLKTFKFNGSSLNEIEESSPLTLDKKMFKKDSPDSLNDIKQPESFRGTIKTKESSRKFQKDPYQNDLESKKNLKFARRQSGRKKSNFYPQSYQEQELQPETNKIAQKRRLGKKIEIHSLKDIPFKSGFNTFIDLNIYEQQELFLWHFDQSKEYKYYFVNGNAKNQIFRYNRFYKKKTKYLQLKKKKKVFIP